MCRFSLWTPHIMKILHANYIWIFNLLSISLILFGFIYLLKTLIPKLLKTLNELSEERRRAEVETKNILLAVTEVNRVMGAIASGDCGKRINVKLTGELNQLKDSINNTATALEAIVKQIKHISLGDYTISIEPQSAQDTLNLALNDMLTSFNTIIRKADSIAKGDLNSEITPRSNKDILGVSLNKMTKNLRDAIKANEKQNWLKTGEAQLNNQMQGAQSLKELAGNVVSFLADYLNIQVGVIFIMDGDALKLTSSYAFNNRSDRKSYKLGEGLVGQAAKEMKIIVFDDVPEDHLDLIVQSGTGESIPESIVLVPLLHENNVKGVMAFGKSCRFSGRYLEFLENVANGVAINIHTVQAKKERNGGAVGKNSRAI